MINYYVNLHNTGIVLHFCSKFSVHIAGERGLNMKRRTKIRLASFAIALILALGGFVYIWYTRAEHYQWLLEANYQHYFSELMESIEQISTTLQKGRYATSPVMVVTLSNEVSRQSALATAALSGLPFSHIELEKTAKFLSQVGDYSFTLSKLKASGLPLSQEEKKNLISLSDTAYQLSGSLNELYNEIFNKNLSIGETFLTNSPDKGIGSVAETLQDIETQFPEYAGLIYDGPFSDHIEKMTPMMLVNAPDVSLQDAMKHVADTFGVDVSSVTHEGDGNGAVPVYSLSADRNGNTLYADVTKKGGFIINMMDSRIVSEANIPVKDCITRAVDFMEKIGIKNMVHNYYISKNNIVTVNFAYTENDITYYPDLIKVSVAQDNGDIVGFESRGYLMSHGIRTLPEIKVSEEEVREKVSDGLKVENVRLAVIPSMGRYEYFCYELKCVDDYGQRCLIYVNVETGVEEQILILVEGDDGILSI